VTFQNRSCNRHVEIPIVIGSVVWARYVVVLHRVYCRDNSDVVAEAVDGCIDGEGVVAPDIVLHEQKSGQESKSFGASRVHIVGWPGGQSLSSP